MKKLYRVKEKGPLSIYYKKNKVAYHIYVSSNGSLSNAEGSEFYWVKRATKSILPAFKNEMINTKLKHIL